MRIPRGALVALATASAGQACAPRPEMCAKAECGAQSACVSGRCVGRGAVVAIGAARRLMVAPVEVACVRCGASDGASPPLVRLGAPAAPLMLLRFAVTLPPDASVLEAYLDLERVEDASDDPPPVALHAVRIAGPWDASSLTWAQLPPLEEVGAPITRARPGSGPRVRIDVRELVHRWQRRSSREFGVAVVAESAGRTGLALALRPMPGAARGPELELYVK